MLESRVSARHVAVVRVCTRGENARGWKGTTRSAYQGYVIATPNSIGDVLYHTSASNPTIHGAASDRVQRARSPLTSRRAQSQPLWTLHSVAHQATQS